MGRAEANEMKGLICKYFEVFFSVKIRIAINILQARRAGAAKERASDIAVAQGTKEACCVHDLRFTLIVLCM